MIIKFNLLPKEEVKPEEVKRKFTFLNVILVVICIIFLIVIGEGIQLKYTLNTLQHKKNEKQKELVKYKKIAEQVKELEKTGKEIEKKIVSIVKLKNKQGDKLKKINTLIGAIGRNRIVFTYLSLNPTKAELVGISPEHKDISLYIESLEKQKPLIKDVTAQTNEKGEYIEFKAEILF